ncbi:MAG: hypothetical protein ACK5JM_09445 [Rhodoblastus sp.]
MMRVLEHGLAWLADDVGVAFGSKIGKTLLTRSKVKLGRRQKTCQGENKNDRLQFLSEAAKEFHFFKDGWRNYVSHGRGIYDEHQARNVLEHVRSGLSVRPSPSLYIGIGGALIVEMFVGQNGRHV